MHDPFRDDEPEALSRARLAAIVESSDDVIVSKTLDGIITSWNPAAERIFGWTAAEAIGRHITLIIPDDRRAEEDDVLARIRRGERVDHFETVRRTRAGRLVDMSIMVSPVKDAAGRIVGASKVGRDINAILRNASAQTRLVEDLLDLSWIVAGRMRLDFEGVDLNATIESALETVRPAARAKDITLVATLDDSLGTMQAAPDRLQQVVWNLLMNSVKFTPSCGRVEIASHRRADSVAIVVTGTGQGIPAEVLPHVFEPFRQEDSSSTRAQGGLGLGLTLVRRLVELHGGTVAAESSGKGRGATFTVTLPLPVSQWVEKR